MNRFDEMKAQAVNEATVLMLAIRLGETTLGHIRDIEDPEGLQDWIDKQPGDPRYLRLIVEAEKQKNLIKNLKRDDLKKLSKKQWRSGEGRVWKFMPAFKRILMAHAMERPYETSDVAVINEALNTPLTRTLVRMIESEGKRIHYLEPQFSESVRTVAELLVKYLGLFLRTPKLVHFKPIAICCRDQCGSLYVRHRSHQEYCSPKCKELEWRARKLRQDPNYYTVRARTSRRVKRGQKKRRKVVDH